MPQRKPWITWIINSYQWFCFSGQSFPQNAKFSKPFFIYLHVMHNSCENDPSTCHQRTVKTLVLESVFTFDVPVTLFFRVLHEPKIFFTCCTLLLIKATVRRWWEFIQLCISDHYRTLRISRELQTLCKVPRIIQFHFACSWLEIQKNSIFHLPSFTSMSEVQCNKTH